MEIAYVVQTPAPDGRWRKLSKCVGNEATDVLVYLDRSQAEAYVEAHPGLGLAVFEVEVRPT